MPGGEQDYYCEAVMNRVTLCFVDDPSLVLRRAGDMLDHGGKLVLGLIVAESPCARYYMAEKRAGHPFHNIAHFYHYEEVLQTLRDVGFKHERTLSTLFQAPGKVVAMESPREGYSAEAGFVLMVARKNCPG